MTHLCSDTLYVSFRAEDVDREIVFQSLTAGLRLASGRAGILTGTSDHKVLSSSLCPRCISSLTQYARVRVGDTDL